MHHRKPWVRVRRLSLQERGWVTDDDTHATSQNSITQSLNAMLIGIKHIYPLCLIRVRCAMKTSYLELFDQSIPIMYFHNLTKVRPLFTLSHRGSDNSPLLIVFSAYYIDQSIVTFMRLKVG